MRSPAERALLTALAVAFVAAAAAAWWTADQWVPHAGPWTRQAWKKITRPGPDTLPPEKRPAQAGAAQSGASVPVACPPRKCLKDGRTIYTDRLCPPGSQEQAVDGALTSLPR